ncbi:melanoma inhibitory activity protein 2 isoform X2 [Pogona vitticeps]
MVGILDTRTLLFILSLLINIKSTKVLSDQKKCGDPECETSISRVQAIKDYTGPDCRYLNFKTGEEIMVYFKLSRKREDLWAGSKGTDFGYFPMDAVQIEDVLITKEVEVPTKETDFLCFDGGEYVFENEENKHNNLDEGNVYISFHKDEKDSELKMPEDEFQKHSSIDPIKEYKETSPEKYELDSKSKGLHSLEIDADSEFKDGKTGQDETNQLEEQSSQALKSVPTQSTWTISGFANWLGLESPENKEAASITSKTTEEITFRHRKITVTEDSDFEKLNEEGKIEPKTSGWFQSTLTDLLYYGSKKTEHGLLNKENDPEIYDSSTFAGNTDDHTLSETRQERHRDFEPIDPEPSKSNWFDLGLSDVLTFGYSKENKVKEELSGREKADNNEEPSAPSAQSALMDEHRRRQTDETGTSEEQNKEKYNKETSKEILESVSSEDGKDEQTENSDLNEVAESTSTDLADKTVNQESKPGNQAIEYINTKAITKESETTRDQSGWYGSIDLKRGTSDNQPGPECVDIMCQQESTADSFLPSHSIGQDFDPIGTQTRRVENQEDPQKHQSFFSISYFTNILNFQGFIAKEKIDVPHAEKALKPGEECFQNKNGDKVLDINKEGKEQILSNDHIIENISQNRHVSTSEENILMSSSTTHSNEEKRMKTQDDESTQEQMPHNLSGRSKSKYRYRRANGRCIQLHWNCTLESLEAQGYSNTEDKHFGHIQEVKQASLLELGNLVDSSDKQHYTRKIIYSHEKSDLMKGEDGETAMLDKTEQVNNSQLQNSGIYLDRKSKGETFDRMNDKTGRSPAIQKLFFPKGPKEYSDTFTQSRDFLTEDIIFLAVSDNGKTVIQEGEEQFLSKNPQAMEDNKVKKISRGLDGSNVQVGVNGHSSKDNTDFKANIFCNTKVEEDGGSQNAASLQFSSSSSQDPDLLKIVCSEEKSKQCEKYLSFESFTDKNYLQTMQENKNTKDGNNLSEDSVELLLRNKDIEERKQLHQKKDKEATVKEGFSEKDILLPSSGEQNGDSENVIKDVQLLIDKPPTQSTEYLLEHTINSLFSQKKLKEKVTQDGEQEFTNTRDNKQSFSEQQHETPVLKFNLQRSQPCKIINRKSRSSKQNKCSVPKILNEKSHTPVIDYTSVMKRIQVSDPLSFLQLLSEKATESHIQDNDVTNIYEETKLADAENPESASPAAIDDFLINNYYHGEMKKSVITMESLNEFPQEEAKEQMCVSERMSKVVENIQRHSEPNAEHESNKQTKEKNINILNKQGLSPGATPQEAFRNDSQILSYNSVVDSVSKNEIQDSQVETAGIGNEEKHDSKTTEEQFVKDQVRDSSLTVRVTYYHNPEEQIKSSYLSPHTLSNKGIDSSKVSPSLTYKKIYEQKLKGDQEVSPSQHKSSDTETISSSQLEVSHRESSNILSLGPEEKSVSQIVPDTKKHLIVDTEVEKFRISSQSNGNVNDKRGKEGVMSNIFSKTSWLLGGLFENRYNKEFTKNSDSRNIIINQIRTDRQEVDTVGSDFEQDKHEVQSTEAISDLENFTIMEQRSGVQIHSTQEKSATTDFRNDNNQKDVTSAIQEAELGFQETAKNGKLIIDTELGLKETSFVTDFHELYSKLTEESKRINQAPKCERHQLQQMEQELEKLHCGITTFPCEGIYRERRQTATSVEHEHKLNTGHEECLKKKTYLLLKLQSLVMDIRNKCGDQNAESDKKLNNGENLKEKHIPPENTEKKIHTSVKNSQHQLNLKEKLLEEKLLTQNNVLIKEAEREWLFQIILYLNDLCAFIASGFSVMISLRKKVIAALPEDMRPGPDLYGFPWEIVICCALISIFIILFLMCRSYQSVRSRFYAGREKQLANKVAELVEDKSKVLEKFSLCKKEYEELESTLEDASLLQGSTVTSDLKTTCEELSSSNSVLKNEIQYLEKELKEEKSKRLEQDDLMAEIQRRVDTLENEAKSVQSQIAEAKTTLKVYEINRERLKTFVEDAIEENKHLHESEKQLLQEAEGWGERFSELNEQAKMFECSKADMEEALKNKESQVKSLTECLLKMKDWSGAIGENDVAEDSHWENIKSETENGEHLDEQEKRTVRKLIYAAKLNACLKSMETERNQVYSKLSDEKKAKEELSERIESLQKEHVLLQSENRDFENEFQKLQQKLKVMTELYQENEMNLHRKLTVEEKERLQKEEKLSKVDEKIIHAAEELTTYRQRAKDLEEELERTVRSYENQIMSHEKKAHDNWLAARAAERHLNDIKKENLHDRQKLTEAEFKYDLLEKDPYALDVPVRTFGREHSPYGPSPMGRPSSETRAFLSPPTLLEGPLRLSPVLPGSRGPGNTGTYDVGNERREINSDMLSDPHRPPSDTGSLSPPWDRDHRIISSHTGQLYNEQPLPSRRPERFYPNHPNSGRLSGPAELRNYNMHSFDKADGLGPENSSRMDLSGNGIKDRPDDTNMVNMIEQSLAPETESFGPAIVPPPLPLLRAPLMPMDPRGPFMRRGPPFPPVPPSSLYGPHEYFPRDFSGPPRPLLQMRGPFPVRPFSQYPPRAGSFPPQPPPSDNRNELPAELTHPSAATSTDHQESQGT